MKIFLYFENSTPSTIIYCWKPCWFSYYPVIYLGDTSCIQILSLKGMERDGKLMFLLLSDIVSWRRVTSSFSKHETVCAIWMLKIVIKKRKKISCITSAYLWPKQTKNQFHRCNGAYIVCFAIIYLWLMSGGAHRLGCLVCNWSRLYQRAGHTWNSVLHLSIAVDQYFLIKFKKPVEQTSWLVSCTTVMQTES